jgi:DNA repair exonuclease SbcCD nuclease subunit
MRKEVQMSLQQVRFIQSGDWRLEMPIGGVAEVPAVLREQFLDAPFLAAERVVQAAIDQRVDFLVLTGNLLPMETACPYTLEFILRQFQRLAESGIAVYWLGAEDDDVDLWPASLALPANVHLFPTGRLHTFEHAVDGKVVVRLMGQSCRKGGSWNAANFAGKDDSAPRVVIATGKVPKRALEGKGVDYWALGGEPRHHVLLHGSTTAVYAGSPQGRDPDDADAHGAVLVELQYGKATTQLIETDLWRWRRERVQAADVESIDDLQTLLNRHWHQVPADTGLFRWLLIWSVVCRGRLAWRLARHEARQSLLETLQRQSAQETRWTMAIETEPAELPSEWYEEDTVLGDFLRAAQRYEQDANAWQELTSYLPEGVTRERLSSDLANVSDDDRQRLWRRVAGWGADLLRGVAVMDEH